MRTLVCGDLHCKPYLLAKALSLTNWDRFIFLGDACDNWGATQENNIFIIKQLIAAKNKYKDKFVWLLGNHDWGYYDDTIRMSGHILAGSANVRYLLEQNKNLWDLAFFDGHYIFSHAGIGREFLLKTQNIPFEEMKNNRGFNNPLNEVGWACGGQSSSPSLLWARPTELTPLFEETIQIVGHTPVNTITKEGDVIICDTMSQYPNGDFIGDRSLLLIENDKFYVLDGSTGEVARELV